MICDLGSSLSKKGGIACDLCFEELGFSSNWRGTLLAISDLGSLFVQKLKTRKADSQTIRRERQTVKQSDAKGKQSDAKGRQSDGATAEIPQQYAPG